ncbi:alpha-N-acetylgalactosamine-specific lectin-like [Macrobrachium rosenbergii]|uniref:alpha-N-acetylgalactosamine-specific lectin-like n=1 Tax=Macrobrachium rosenbergii TaxID=79674 RepID=UPI0034D4C52D
MAFASRTLHLVCIGLLFSHISLGRVVQTSFVPESFAELSDKVQDIKSFLDFKQEVKSTILLNQLEFLLKTAELEGNIGNRNSRDLTNLESRFSQMELKIDGLPAEGINAHSTDPKCKEGWQYFQNSCYFFSNAEGSWEEGRKDCLDMAGDYVKITTHEEFNFVGSQVKASAWIGLDDLAAEGNYTWVLEGNQQTEPPRTWWHPNQPDNHGGAEDCIHYWIRDDKKPLWNDHRCHMKFRYVCEMNTTANLSTPLLL